MAESHAADERLMRQLHQLVTRETDREWAGRYRTRTVAIAGASHTPPEAIDVPAATARVEGVRLQIRYATRSIQGRVVFSNGAGFGVFDSRVRLSLQRRNLPFLSEMKTNPRLLLRRLSASGIE